MLFRLSIKKYCIVMLAITTVFALTLIGKSAAQETESITLNVSPTVVELDANPGDSIKGSFKITNGSDIDLTLTATAKNFTANDELGGVNITEDDTSYSLAKWITVTPSEINTVARGSQIFDYVIDVPEDAEPGGHFGAIIVKTDAVRVDVSGPSVSQEVGPLLLVKIAGDTYQEASIVEFSTVDSLVEKGPISFQTRVKNTGNVHFKPKGTIEIKDTFGRTVTTLDLEEKNILPDTIRRLVNDWNPGGFTVGRYTANLALVYGVDDTIVTSTTSFIVFPYKTVVPILVIIIILISLIFKNRLRIKKAISVLKNG